MAEIIIELARDCQLPLLALVTGLKENLDLLSRVPEPAIEHAARTLPDLRESWEWATKEEREDLALMWLLSGCFRLRLVLTSICCSNSLTT